MKGRARTVQDSRQGVPGVAQHSRQGVPGHCTLYRRRAGRQARESPQNESEELDGAVELDGADVGWASSDESLEN